MLLCCMAAVAAVVWYCLLSAGKSSTQMDGTFVELPADCIERTIA